MLKQLRDKKTAKKIWITLAVIVLPAFLFWGLGDFVRNKQGSDYVGRIEGKNISLLEYKDAVDALRNQLIMQYRLDASQAKQYPNMDSEVWTRLVLLAEAKIRKINVSDRQVIEFLQTYPFFQRKGRFDNRLYTESMRYDFHTQPRVFEEQIRQNLILLKLYQEITKNIAAINDEETKEAYRKANEEISVYYISASSAEFAKNIAPSEEETREYFAANLLEFKQPISYNVEYVFADSEAKMKNILMRLKKKRDFAGAAKDMGLEAKETGLFAQDTGFIPGIGWSPEILTIISKLKTGQLSPPINADNKYYIFRLKERKEAHMPDFETVQEKVREAYIAKKSKGAAREPLEICLAELKENYAANPKAVDFEKIAQKYGLKAGSTGMFKYGSYIDGIGSSDSFWLAADKLKENEPSSVIEGASALYVARLKDRTPIDEKKFENEKKEFSSQLLLQKKYASFIKFTEELKRRSQKFQP